MRDAGQGSGLQGLRRGAPISKRSPTKHTYYLFNFPGLFYSPIELGLTPRVSSAHYCEVN
jgi:hypothetical protein